VKISNEAIAVIGIDVELSYEDRMDMIRMLSYGGTEPVMMRVQTYDHPSEPTAHISVAGSFGRAVKVYDYAVKMHEGVSA